MEGLPPLVFPPRTDWPVHLKATTMADIAEIRMLPLHHADLRPHLMQCLEYLRADVFKGFTTSRTIRSTRLTDETVKKFVEEFGKATHLPDLSEPLPPDTHGVNMWLTPEAKIRQRIINEPLLNGAIGKHTLPPTKYPSRLERRQRLRPCKYMLQLDFDAFYNSLPLDPLARILFVFKKSGRYYGLNTVPTGGRWSVATGQAITWAITDIETTVTLLTMIDNIAIGAHEGQELQFIRAVREIVNRTKLANLQTTPPAATIESMSDKELLDFATREVTFLGETYEWNGSERLVRNSTKTLAKLSLALRKPHHTYRTFAALCSLIMFALHTIGTNPASTYNLMQAYRAISRTVSESSWDSPVPFLSATVRAALDEHGALLLANAPARIPDRRWVTYDDDDFQVAVFIDASADGWGAIIRFGRETTVQVQQRWVNTLGDQAWEQKGNTPAGVFTARYSAHTEPEAINRVLEHLQRTNRITTRTKIAVVSDHFAVTHAQRKLNGFGGIGRGRSLNHMYERANALNVCFFFIAGASNPADTISRNFGAIEGGEITESNADDIALPLLRTTYCPLAEEEGRPEWMR
jgi:hypothetical protein